MKLSFKRNRGLETVFAETRHIGLHPEVVTFFFENGIVRVTPRDGEWDSEDLISHFLLAGFPKQYEIELGNMINNLLHKAGVTQIAAWLESFTLAFVKGITQYNARGMKNYYTSVYNRIDTIVFDGSQSTCVWAERLAGMDKAA